MRWFLMAMVAGCSAQDGLLAVRDADGVAVGSYERATGTVELVVDGDAVQGPDGSVWSLDGGAGIVDGSLEAGDELVLVDVDGEPIETLTLDETDEDGDGRLMICADLSIPGL